MEEEKKAALSNGILLLDKELAELKLRKKETLEAQSRRHAIARNIAAANVKKEEIREKLRQATKKKQDKEEMVKGQQERLTQKKAKSNDLLAKLNEVLSQGDLCRQKIEESKIEVVSIPSIRFYCVF